MPAKIFSRPQTRAASLTGSRIRVQGSANLLALMHARLLPRVRAHGGYSSVSHHARLCARVAVHAHARSGISRRHGRLCDCAGCVPSRKRARAWRLPVSRDGGRVLNFHPLFNRRRYGVDYINLIPTRARRPVPLEPKGRDSGDLTIGERVARAGRCKYLDGLLRAKRGCCNRNPSGNLSLPPIEITRSYARV